MTATEPQSDLYAALLENILDAALNGRPKEVQRYLALAKNPRELAKLVDDEPEEEVDEAGNYQAAEAALREWQAQAARYAAQHAPVGGVTVGGTFFKGGEFIPAEAMADATAEERAAVEGEAAPEPAAPAELPDKSPAKSSDEIESRPRLRLPSSVTSESVGLTIIEYFKSHHWSVRTHTAATGTKYIKINSPDGCEYKIRVSDHANTSKNPDVTANSRDADFNVVVGKGGRVGNGWNELADFDWESFTAKDWRDACGQNPNDLSDWDRKAYLAAHDAEKDDPRIGYALEPYSGPRGGKGERDTVTGRIRYTTAPSGERPTGHARPRVVDPRKDDKSTYWLADWYCRHWNTLLELGWPVPPEELEAAEQELEGGDTAVWLDHETGEWETVPLEVKEEAPTRYEREPEPVGPSAMDTQAYLNALAASPTSFTDDAKSLLIDRLHEHTPDELMALKADLEASLEAEPVSPEPPKIEPPKRANKVRKIARDAKGDIVSVEEMDEGATVKKVRKIERDAKGDISQVVESEEPV